MQQVAGLRDDAGKERFGALEKTLREIHRSVQIVRDRQELAEASAELAKLSAAAASGGGASGAPAPAAASAVAPPTIAAPASSTNAASPISRSSTPRSAGGAGST